MTCDLQMPWPATAKQLRVGDIRLDLRYRRVERDGECIELPQRMFDLLLLFVAEPHHLHGRADLFRRIWPGVIVEDGNLSQSVWMLRKALGESRRGWLRTVAKRGYVFEPPCAVEPVAEEECIPSVASAAEGVPGGEPATSTRPESLSSTGRSATRSVGRRRGTGFAAAAALVLAVTALVSLGSRLAAPSSPLAVSLIVLADPADGTGAVPAGLLEAWLSWQLTMLPDIQLLSSAHLAADRDKQEGTRLVTLSAGPVDAGPHHLYVQASIQGGQAVRAEGPVGQMAFLVDQVAGQVRDLLVPERAGQSWPALAVSAEVAERFLGLRRTRMARQWAQASEIGNALLQDAPDFGLAWYEIAQVEQMLGRTQPAQAALDRTRALLSPLPKDIGWLIEAQWLALGTDHDAAVVAFSELARAYPHQPYFSLELARAYIRAGQYREALAILTPDVWTRQPVSVRISQLLVRADAEQAMGDGAAARISALQADAIAERAGWPHERGWATLLLAQSHALEQRDPTDMSLFDQAAAYFELAGDELHALRSRLLAATFSADGGPGSDEQLDVLLARANDVGHPRLAMHALRTVAYRHYRDGRLEAYRRRLGEAEDLARSTEDQHALALFEVDRVNEDIMSGDLRRAGRRLDRVRRAGGMQGDAGQWLDYFDAYLAYREGRFDDALRRLEALGGSDVVAAVPADLQHCLRGAVAITRGDPKQAREDYGRCAASPVPIVRLVGETGLAQVDVQDGEFDAARVRLGSVLERVPGLDSVPDRWLVECEAAGALLRAGDHDGAARLYRALVASLDGSGYRLLESDALIGMAELAVLDGDWDGAGRYIAEAEAKRQASDWLLDSRLALVRVVHAEAVGEHNAAAGHLHRLDRQARRLGDDIVLDVGHDLFHALAVDHECAGERGEAVVADAGRTPHWLLTALPLRLADAVPGG